jgi:hypothetical protein
MKTMLRTFLFVVMLAVAAFGQSAPTVTTLSAAIDSKQEYITIASATGWSANSSSNHYLALVDKEAMEVVSISGTQVKVKRGTEGTHSDAHLSGDQVVWIDARYMLTAEPSGACTASSVGVNPKPLLNSNRFFYCSGGASGGKWYEIGGQGSLVVESIFCGDMGNATALYDSPVTGYSAGNFYTGGLTANDLSYALAGSGCSAEDNATEATADEIMFPANEAVVVGMYCAVDSSGAGGVTMSVRSAAAELGVPYTLTIPTSTTSGATQRKGLGVIAANATVALKTVSTSDLSSNDNWCVVRFQVIPASNP